MTDVFRECRERVSAQDAAHHYGLTFDRRGWAICPFHADKHPSMSFKNGRFRCWVCNISGDCIDLTSGLLGVDNIGAVRQLNKDFALALPLDREPTQEERQQARRQKEIAKAHAAFEEWRREFSLKLCYAFRAGHIANGQIERPEDMDKLTERENTAIRLQACFEYWGDVLEHGTPEEQAQIFRERGQISRWIEKVLSD